jgi:hypothetical protein
MSVVVALASLHVTGHATPMPEAFPVVVSSTSAGFVFTNTSTSYVFVTWTLSGMNFRAEMPCEGTVFLRPESTSSAVAVEARNRAKPRDYQVKVTKLETKTLGELRRDAAAEKDIPVATPLSAASARALEALRCQSRWTTQCGQARDARDW